MNRLKYLFAICIAITALNFEALNAATVIEEERAKTNIVEELKELGQFRDGVLHVSATEAALLLKEKDNIRVLDVRTGFEYDRGHIEGAVQINYYWFGFEEKLATLDKETSWLVHCKSGVRSGKTLPLMKKAGFKSIIHMDGGINSWRDAKLPVASAK